MFPETPSLLVRGKRNLKKSAAAAQCRPSPPLPPTTPQRSRSVQLPNAARQGAASHRQAAYRSELDGGAGASSKTVDDGPT